MLNCCGPHNIIIIAVVLIITGIINVIFTKLCIIIVLCLLLRYSSHMYKKYIYIKNATHS